MIKQLTGTIAYISDKYTIIDVHGVGYQVFCPAETITGLTESATYRLWTYMAVREDALELFGFLEADTLRMFELLITISGIGPRGALAILNVGSVDMLESAIASGDTAFLTKISGIGRKTAEKIVLELRDKITALGRSTDGVGHAGELDTMEALKALGYTAQEIRDTLKDIDPSITDTSDKIREALKRLGGK